MHEWRRSRFGNPSTWYLILGVAMIGVTLWLPWLAATRTVRIEGRAARIAELLLAAATPLSWPLDADDIEHMHGRMVALLNADGVFVGDLEPLPELPAGVLYLGQNKHYAFQLAVSPPDSRTKAGPDTRPALEVLAWPLENSGPGHCAWFVAENAPRAYTRNLAADYHGLQQHRPRPGSAQRVPGTGAGVVSAYRAAQDERWILF